MMEKNCTIRSFKIVLVLEKQKIKAIESSERAFNNKEIIYFSKFHKNTKNVCKRIGQGENCPNEKAQNTKNEKEKKREAKRLKISVTRWLDYFSIFGHL